MKLHVNTESGVRKLLCLLEDKDVLALADTITNKQFAVFNRSDATNAIIRFSDSIEDLLRRKKLKREILFKYLAQEQVDVSPTAEKGALAEQIIQLWKQRSQQKNDVTSLATAAKHVVATVQSTPVRDVIPSGGITYNIVNKFEFNQTPPSQQYAPVLQSEPQPDLVSTHPLQGMTFSLLAKEFAEWFYKMLNSCNPYLGTESNFGPIHFFPDCWMKHVMIINERTEESELRGADTVCQKLIEFVQKEGVLFNPNLDHGGTASKNNAYGMTIVQVCGTVHQQQQMIGIFEQRFGIIKDPSMDFNWRIKFTHLCARPGCPSQQPALGGQMTSLLPLTEN